MLLRGQNHGALGPSRTITDRFSEASIHLGEAPPLTEHKGTEVQPVSTVNRAVQVEF